MHATDAVPQPTDDHPAFTDADLWYLADTFRAAERREIEHRLTSAFASIFEPRKLAPIDRERAHCERRGV